MKYLFTVLILLMLAVPVMAHDVIDAPAALVVKPFEWVKYTGVNNFEVDGHYFLNGSLRGNAGVGTAYEFAQLANNMIGARLEIVIPVDADEQAPDKLGGLGLSLKLHNVVNEVGGKTLIPSNIQVGISATVDLTHGLDIEALKNPYLSLLVVGISF